MRTTVAVSAVAVFAFALVQPTTVSAQLMNCPWPVFRHDSLNSGRGATQGPASGSLSWQCDSGLGALCSPVCDGGAVYAAGGGSLVAVSTGGALLWSLPCGAGSSSTPAVGADGTIYAGSGDCNLYAVNPDGSLKWKRALAGRGDAPASIGPDSTVFIGSSTGAIRAFAPDGSVKFSYTAGGAITTAPAIAADGTVYFGADDGIVYALNASGGLKWKFATNPKQPVRSTPAVLSDGGVCFGCMNGYVYGIGAGGSQRWRFTTGGPVCSSPGVSADGSIYIGCRDRYVYALTSYGALRWKFKTGHYVDSSPVIDALGSVYAGSNDGWVYALSSNGALLWKVDTGAPVWSSPALGGAGIMHIGGGDGRLLSYGRDITPPPVPIVTDGGAFGTSTDSLHASWRCRDPESAIVSIEYALGTSPGAQDVVAFTPVGIDSQVALTGLRLVNGADYYFSVRCSNSVGLTSGVGYSDGIRVDWTPPVAPVVIDDGDWIGSGPIHVVYSSGDPESGIERYELSVGSSPGASDIKTWFAVDLSKEETIAGIVYAHNSPYFVNARAVNRAGLASVGSSNGLRADLTPPSISDVRAYGSTYEFTVQVTASDAESGVSSIDYCLLTTPQIPASPAWQSSAYGSDIAIPGPFQDAQNYYAAVRVRNLVGLVSAVSIREVEKIDLTPPTTPVVTDPGAFCADAGAVTATWTAEDRESGIHHYSYCIGTTSGASDVVPWTDTTLAAAGVPRELTRNGATYYFAVKATNPSGLTSGVGISDGVRLDSSPPPRPVVFDDGEYTPIPDVLHASWACEDPESGIVEAQFCVGTTPGGSDVLPWGPAAVDHAIATGLDLQAGVGYYLSAKLRNGAGLWSEVGATDGIEYKRGPSPWPKFRYDLRNSGCAPAQGCLSGRLAWRFRTDGYVDSSPILAADGAVLVGSGDGKLYAISAGGTLRWAYQTGGPVDSTPAISPTGAICFGSYDGYLYCLNPGGTLKWRYKAGGMIWSSPAVSTDGTVYFGCRAGFVYAVDSAGALKWKCATGGPLWSSPALAQDGTVYIGSGDGKLYAITSAGRVRWTYQTGSAVDSSPAIGPDGAVYFGSGDAKFYAVNPDGGRRWEFHTGSLPDASASVASDGTVYIGAGVAGGTGAVYALDSAGRETWRLLFAGAVRSSPAVGRDGVIYFGTGDGKFHALRPDGTMLWSYSAADSILSSPAIGADTSVVVGSDDGYVYCFRDYNTADPTPPGTPCVCAGTEVLEAGQALSPTWLSDDGESGVRGYSFCVGSKAGVDDLVAWTYAGVENTVTLGGLTPIAGRDYYVSVIATNYSGLTSAVGVSRPFRALPGAPQSRIGNVCLRKPGESVSLVAKVVVAVFGDCVVVEEPDRSRGIICRLSGAAVATGAVVNVTGTRGVWGDAPCIENAALQDTGITFSIQPLGISPSQVSIGGASPYGLLVRFAGRVKKSEADYFVISDGSCVLSPRGCAGLEVRPSGAEIPATGEVVVATGVFFSERIGSVNAPVLRATSVRVVR